MNIDDLISSCKNVSHDPVVSRLTELLTLWKLDDRTVDQLRDHIERFIGNTWIQDRDEHNQVYELWTEFRDANIRGIGGMTMNERLYAFGLIERFDTCEDDDSRARIYKKLNSHP